MNLKRRTFLKTSGALPVALLAPGLVRAATYPDRPVTLTVPFNPGGGADRSARLFAPYLAEALGVPVQVTNVAGGGGWLAWSQMAKWDPDRDDHKLGIVNLPHLFSYMDPRMNRTETVDSFNILAWHSYDPCIWAVREGDERFQTLEALLDHIGKNPDDVIMSTTGVGSDDHMGIAFAERFLPDFRVRKVYSNNDNKKIHETLSGTTDVVAGNVGYYVPFMLEGRLRPVCVLHDERWAQLPSVKTFHEVTGQKNISYAGRTIAAAPGLPEEKREILLGAIEKAINHPEYVIREINSKNQLMFLKGDALRRKLEESATLAASVRFWEAEE